MKNRKEKKKILVIVANYRKKNNCGWIVWFFVASHPPWVRKVEHLHRQPPTCCFPTIDFSVAIPNNADAKFDN